MTSPALFARFFADATLAPPSEAPATEAITQLGAARDAGYGDLLGPIVVADRTLAELGRAAGDSGPIDVRVVNTGGAGGLLALAGRTIAGLRIVAVDSALRDLDDLAGNAGRVIAAAERLDPDIGVHVEFPYAPGWEDAVAEVEAAGLLGKLRTGDDPWGPESERLARQLSVLIEADLPFSVDGLEHLRSSAEGAGVLDILLGVRALIDGTSEAEAAALIAGRADAAEIEGWDDATAVRIRRRCLGVGVRDLPRMLSELDSSGLAGIR